AADTKAASSGHDQYEGGRWDPESNIWIGGEAFAAALLKGGRTPDDGDQKSAMWEAGAIYNGTTITTASGEIYAAKLKKAVMVTPGFLKLTESVMPQLRANRQTITKKNTSGTTGSDLLPRDWPDADQCEA